MNWIVWAALAVLVPPLTRTFFIAGIRDYNDWQDGTLRWGETLLDHWWCCCAFFSALVFLVVLEPLFNWIYLTLIMRSLRGLTWLSTSRLKWFEAHGNGRQVMRAWAICAKLNGIDERHC